MYRTDKIIPKRGKTGYKKRNVFLPKVRTTNEEKEFVKEKIREYNLNLYWGHNKLTYSKLIRRLLNNWIRSENYKSEIRF